MPGDDLLKAAFWGALLLVVYSYALYPALLWLVVKLRGPRAGVASSESGGSNAMAVDVACIVSAFNEQRHVVARVENFLAQRHEGGHLRVYVGSDGSSDDTAELIKGLASEQVVAMPFEKNRGKASVLNDLVAAAREPILVLSDANTLFEPNAVARMLAHFKDPSVGAVCGELRLLDARGNNQDSAYWRYEQFLKRKEAELGGLLGANGAIYAIRRSLYQPLAADTIVDDFCIAMDVVVQGYKLVYEPQAVALEDTPDTMTDEYRRRVRIGIGNFQAFFRRPAYLLKTNWATRFTYLSHKVLRWFTPHLLLVALIASTLLGLAHPGYAMLAALQWATYGVTWLQHVSGAAWRLPKPLGLLLFFLTLNLAFAVAFWRYATGRYSGSWRRTERS
jgi:cellulose synthase/poly-beta-1,6-N-acetylglucosamine synthase-like glycosyltransferase